MPAAICQQCRKQFEARRSTARFCSGKCRITYYRAQKEYEEENPPVESQVQPDELVNHAPGYLDLRPRHFVHNPEKGPCSICGDDAIMPAFSVQKGN